MEIANNELHIWRYTIGEDEYANERTAPILSKQEKERCGQYLNEAEKIRYTCNHRFVRQVLAKYLNIAPAQIEFNIAGQGKPFIKNKDLFFSYSYRTAYGLLAVSKQENVGVDIEKMKVLNDPPTFAAFSFSEKEKEIIFKSDPENFQETLFTFWTFKEAVIKALGVGLNADLTRIDLSAFFYSVINKINFDNDDTYTVKEIKTMEGYKAAFAIKGELTNYKEFNYNPQLN